jgi:hypothetical protein
MFGKNRERLRQWSLLGHLLRRLPPLDALDFMDRAFGAKPVPWPLIQGELAAGGSLLRSARSSSLETPPEILKALEQGEKDGELPARLSEIDVDEAGGFADRAADDGIVVLVNGLFSAAAQGGASGIIVQRLENGDGQTKVYQGQAWTVHSRHPAEEYAAVVRRILAMCSQPYWAPKPALFTMKMWGGEDLDLRVTPDGKGGLGIELLRKVPS